MCALCYLWHIFCTVFVLFFYCISLFYMYSRDVSLQFRCSIFNKCILSEPLAMLSPTLISMVAFGTMMSMCTGMHCGFFCNHYPIRVFKLLVIVGDLDGGGYKMFSCRYTNTNRCLLSLWSSSNQGGGGVGSDFLSPIISLFVLSLLVNYNRILVCSDAWRCALRQSGILLFQRWSTQNFLTSKYILIQHLTLLHFDTLHCP